MFKKSYLPIFAAFILSCSISHGQSFIEILPSDLGFGVGETVSGSFDISDILGVPDNTVGLQVFNGFVNANVDTFTVAEGDDTTFILSGTGVEAFVEHGANLGTGAFTSGSFPRDGVVAAAGESFTLLDNASFPINNALFTPGSTGLATFVDYTGPETNSLASNGSNFRFESDQTVSSFTVFTNNTLGFNNNFDVGFAVPSVPEPTSGVVLGVASLFLMRRKRS